VPRRAITDRGYRGVNEVEEATILMPRVEKRNKRNIKN